MRLGIGSYTYGWSSGAYGGEISRQGGIRYLTAMELIDKAVALDVSVVQICVKPDVAAMSDSQLKGIRGYAEEKRIELEIGTTGSDPDHLLRFLEIAEILGAKLIRTIFTQASSELGEERKNIGKIAHRFSDAQVYLAIENHEAASFMDLRLLCEHTANPFVGICLDTVNSLGRGEGVKEVSEALNPFTKCLHVKDFSVTRHNADQGFIISGAPAGEGKLDIPAQLNMLHSNFADASVILEQWIPFIDNLDKTIQTQDEWAETSIAFLKKSLAQLAAV